MFTLCEVEISFSNFLNATNINNAIWTVITGLFLALLVFIYREFIKPVPDINGFWTMCSEISKSEYNPYLKLVIYYKIIVIQEGRELFGHGEKVSEIKSDGNKHEYPPEKRVLIQIQGYVKHNYLKPSTIVLKIEEKGRIRTPTTFIKLNKRSKLVWAGVFNSTAANSSGIVEWEKDR